MNRQHIRNALLALALAASPAAAQQTSLTLRDVPNSGRPISWYSNTTQLWTIGINTADDHLGLYAYSPVNGSYIGAPFQFNSTKAEIDRGWTEIAAVSRSSDLNGVIGAYRSYTNTSGHTSQGESLYYTSNGSLPGSDIGSTRIAVNNSTTFPATGFVGVYADWVVAISPTVGGPTVGWQVNGSELNVVNRSGDRGLRTNRRDAYDSITGYLSVPEAQTFGAGGTNTYNADFAFATGSSSGTSAATGQQNKWHVGYLCDQDSVVGGDGYCFFANGDTASNAAFRPYSPFGANGAFLHGIDMTAATIGDGVALKMAAGQAIGVGAAVGLTATLHAGACTLTVNGGIITAQSGC